MKKEKQGITRRDFLRGATTAALFGSLGLWGKEEVWDSEKTKVVLVRHPEVVDAANRVDYGIIQQMLDQAIATLIGEKIPNEAWKKIVKPEDVVGIKTNIWRSLPTPPEVERALKTRVMEVGIPESSIKIQDRGVYRDSFFQRVTALLNVRPLRTHHWSGIGGCLKNYMPFVPRPSAYHSDSCANLAAIWQLPVVKGKNRLNVLLALTPLFHGIGPHHFNRQYVWPYRGILVGQDPVALDALGIKLLEAKRAQYFGESKPFTPPPKHVYIAETKYHLGVADPRRIELIRIGWQEEILI